MIARPLRSASTGLAARLTTRFATRLLTRPGICLAASLLLFAALARAERVQNLSAPTDYVSDFAHVLDPAAIAHLDSICSQLDHGKSNAQVAIVTVHNLDGDDKADFANRLEEKWKVGRKGSDRGVLMLFSIDDHQYWIEVGYGLEGILPDGKVGDIGRIMVPALKAGDYDGAVTSGLVQVAQVIATDAGATLTDANPYPDQELAPVRRHAISPLGLVIRIVIVLAVLIFLGSRGLFGLFLGMLMGGGFGGGFGGGGFGGGDSGGGGFGGFGGGESGGGGAGGDW
uniref:TPM domain-containing protein n=1 Tax=mine drainage metagenome TaxID=410659 RepID=E6PZ93_9ZZZZ